MGLGKTYSTKYIADSNNNTGVAGQVLSTTATGIDWVDANTVPGAGLWITIGNNIYNSNSGNVGIGTTSVDEKLQVEAGNIKIEGGATSSIRGLIIAHTGQTGNQTLLVQNSGSSIGHLYTTERALRIEAGQGGSSSGGTLDFWVNQSERMMIDTSGNVGIGTTSPTRKLQVDSAASYPLSVNSTQQYLMEFARNGVSEWWFAINNGDFKFHENGVGDQVVIQAGGNVGIGTTSPGSKLEVKTSGFNTTIELDNSDTQYSVIQHNALGALKGFTGYNSGFMIYGGESGVTTRLQAGGAYAATILTNGNFGIGTTSPNTKLTVETSNESLYDVLAVHNGITGTSALGKGAAIRIGSGNNGNYSTKIATIYEGNNPSYLQPALAFFTMNNSYLIGSETERMRITAPGGISFGSTGTAYGTSGQILKSNGNAPPTWVAASTVIGGPYLPLAGGTLTGALTGTSANFAGNVNVTGTSSTFNTGNSGTFVTNDSSNYPRITTASSSAQLGLFRSATSVGGMYIGADSIGFRLMNASFGSKFTVSQAGNAVFSGNVTLNEDLNFSTNGFADISNTGTGSMRFKPSSQTLALTLTGANATFAGAVGVGVTGGSNAKLEVASTSGEVFRADSSGGAFRLVVDQTGVNTQGVLVHTGNATFAGTGTFTGGGNTLLLKKGTGNPAIAFAGTATDPEASALIEGIAGGGLNFYTSNGGTIGTPAWSSKLTIAAGGNATFAGGITATYGNFSSAVNALYFRTAAANSDYSLLTRDSTGNALFVQNAQSGTDQNIAIFQYGSAAVNQGTTVLQVAKDKSYFANCNVGIGTTTPNVGRLEVGGASPTLAINSSTNTDPTLFLLRNGGANGIGLLKVRDGGHLSFDTGATGAAQSEKMRITSAGGISFGSTGTAYGTSGQVLTSAGNASPTWTTPSSGGGIGGSIAATQLAFGSATANEITGESALVYSNLNGLTIGTGGVSSSNSILNLNKGASGQCRIQMKSAGNTAFDIKLDSSEDAYITADNALTLTSGNSEHIILSPAGNVGIGTTSPTSYKLDVTGTGRFTSTVTATNFILSSDKRLKDNIKNIDNNHIDVDWKNFELKSEPGIKRSGVIAQELEEKHPEFVRTDKEGLKSVAYIDLLIAKIAELEARLEKAGI